MSEICFIDARPRIVATGAETAVRLAGGGSDTEYYRAGQHYRAGVVAMPRFRAAFGFDDNGWTGGTVPTTGDLGFMPGAANLIEELAAYYWRDAAITIDAGDERAALTRRLTGTVAGIVANDGQIALTITDPAMLLDKPLLGAGFDGSGGIEGPVEAAGRAKRRSWGQLFNIPGGLLDKANNIHEFGDPSKPLQAFDAVRDMGRAGPLTLLGWQGSIAATFAALQAAAAPQGGGVVAPSIACVKWWTQPAGPLTADIRGETGGGYASTAVAIAARMLTAVGGPAIVGQAAADALRPATCGVHIATSSDTVAQAIDKLFLGSSLFWVLQPDGTIRIGAWAWKAPVAAFEAIFIGRERQLPPVKSRKVGYRRNHQVHQASEISVAATGNLLVQPTPPSADTAFPGQLWQDGQGQYWRCRDDVHLSVGGKRIMIGGKLPTITWTPNGTQPVTAISAAAAAAQAAADAAMGQASAANEALGRIADDNLLTAGEKPTAILERDTIVNEQAGIDAQATAFGITTEKTAYDNAVSALTSYLAGLTAPKLWSDLSGDTTIVGTAFRSAFGDVFAARQALLNKISAVAKAAADAANAAAAAAAAAAGTAQAGANIANALLSEIASDFLLTPGEKPSVIKERDALTGEQAGIDAQATSFGITTEKTAYDNAVSALTSYLAGLTTPFLWSNLAGNTDIVGATFRSKFGDVYSTRQALLNKIASEAGKRSLWSGISGTGKPEDGADVTANAQVTVSPPVAQKISRDWQSVPKAGQLPRTLTPSVTRGGVDYRTNNAVAYSVTGTGGLTGFVSVNNSNGSADKGRITIADTMTGAGTIILSVSVDGVSLGSFTVKVDVEDDDPPGGGGSGSSAGISASIPNATPIAITPDLPVIVGPAGQINLSAAYSFITSLSGGSQSMTTEWYEWNGSAWVAVSSSQVAASNAYVPTAGDPGSGSNARTITGRTASSTTKFRLYGFNSGGTTGAARSVSGLATVSSS